MTIENSGIDGGLEEIWFERDGARLFATASGAGRTVILLHGGLANHESARRFVSPLGPGIRLVTPDLRASGRSHFAGALSFAQLADDVAALARHLGVARAVIAGASLGAGVATAVALRHPALVEALVVLMPAFAGADVGLTPAQEAAMRAMDAAGSRAPAEGVQVLLPLFDALPPEIRARARALVMSYDAASVATSTRFMNSGAQPFASARELRAITAPVLVVPGMDATHPPEVADAYRRHLPRCTVREAALERYGAVLAELVAGLA